MKKTASSISLFLAAMLAAGTAVGAGYGKEGSTGSSSGMQQPQSSVSGQVSGQAGQQAKLASLDQLSSYQVQTRQGEQLGRVQNVIVDVQEGRIGYVVIGSDSEGAIGQKYIVPWNALQTTAAQQNVLTLNADRSQLRQAPQGDLLQALSQEQGAQIHQHYGVAPYWEEGSMEGATPSPSGIPEDMEQPDQQQQQQPMDR